MRNTLCNCHDIDGHADKSITTDIRKLIQLNRNLEDRVTSLWLLIIYNTGKLQMQHWNWTEYLHWCLSYLVGCCRLHGLMSIEQNPIDSEYSASLQFPAFPYFLI